MQVIMWSTISMCSMLRPGGLEHALLEKSWKTDLLRLNLRAFQSHNHACCISHMTTIAHADLMLLYLLYLWIMISTKKKSWASSIAVNLLPSSFRDHPGLAKYRRVSRLLLGKSPQQLDCKKNWIYTYRIHQFFRHDHPSSIDLWNYFCWALNWITARFTWYKSYWP